MEIFNDKKQMNREYIMGTAENYLQKYFGYNTFRSPQEEIINNVLQGKDTVVLMPTGGGKSMCYQLPALMMEGLTLVISPLISLMKDQVDALKSNGIEAEYLNSSLSDIEERMINQKITSNQLKILYISPEKLLRSSIFGQLKYYNIKLIAIDEAHCTSQWGHDFRPEYAQLKRIRETYPEIPIIALTATADRAVRSDIAELLGMRDEQVFISSFDRPNLSLAVVPATNRYNQILKMIGKHADQSGIIYCSSRKQTEKLTEKLVSEGYDVACYHAGLDPLERSRVQAAFIEGKLKIIVATIAFGMGIDKPDVRFVMHYNLPKNLEGYYQEIGRAGRDGLPSETILFYGYGDVATQMHFINQIENEEYRKIQEDKLKRIQEYAESQICRRKVLLAYFSEQTAADCGNCDVCLNPPKYENGTIPAQMALSAITRTNEQTGMTTTIDILKGTFTPSIKENGYDTLKTFGAGRQITASNWAMYIQQFIQQGIIEIDYKDHSKLKLNEASRMVLSGQKEVKLVSYETTVERRNAGKVPKVQKAISALTPDENLFVLLRKVRKSIADKEGKLPYHVFGDATLKQMAAIVPLTKEELLRVTGVGEYKAQKYGDFFLDVISDFVKGNPELKNQSAQTFHATPEPEKKAMKPLVGKEQKNQILDLFRQKYTIEQIAAEFARSKETILKYLLEFYRNNPESLDVYQLVTHEQVELVKAAKNALDQTDRLKPYYDYFNGQLDYDVIRVSLAVLQMNQ